MARRQRVSRGIDDIVNETFIQLKILSHSCESYDNGLEEIARHIALSLRVLLHHKGHSRSLFEQVKIRNMSYLDTAGDLDPRNLISECNLVKMRIQSGDNGTSLSYEPLLADFQDIRPHKVKLVLFDKWWNKNVIKDKDGQFMSRRTLILNVADTDGGAHVDPELDEIYNNFSRNNSLGWIISDGNLAEYKGVNPHLAAVRQIAYEVIETVRLKQPHYLQQTMS